jgi:hypothetical protein
MGIANEDQYLSNRPRPFALPGIESAASRSPTGASATEDDVGEEEEGKGKREKVRLVTRFSAKTAGRREQVRRGRGSPELKTIDESGAGVSEEEGPGARSPAEERKERFRIDEYKVRVGESLADAISLRDQVLALDSDLYLEEEAIEEDHKALQVHTTPRSASIKSSVLPRA